MTSLRERLATAVEMLAEGRGQPLSASDRAIRLVYDPELDGGMAGELHAFTQALGLAGVPFCTLDLTTLRFEVLNERGLLARSYGLDVAKPDAFRRDMARRLGARLIALIVETASALAEGTIVLQHAAALFPWVSYSSVLRSLPSDMPCVVLVPIPGTETATSLSFFGRRDGFDYIARRV
jgi:hypothetical protein